MREITEGHYYFVESAMVEKGEFEEIFINATVRDYRDDDYLPVGQNTVDCYEITKIETDVFKADLKNMSVTATCIFMEAIEKYFGCKWDDIEKMVTDLYVENYPVSGE